jgi:hypothetical protein
VFQVFGLGEWQARFWSGITSYFTILLGCWKIEQLWTYLSCAKLTVFIYRHSA